MNDNSNEINKENPVFQITPNKELFKEIIKEANLPEEKVKEELPNLDKEWKEDTIEPIKTATDQEKIDAYNKLEVQDLPADWKAQLLRLKYLEGQLSDYNQIKEELKGWTDTFSEKKPTKVQEEIKNLEEEKTKTDEELNSWKETFTNQDPQGVNKKLVELGKNNDLVEQEIKRISKELNEWKQTWNNKELEEVKEEWDILNKRPDIDISTQKFYDDYARRKSQDQSKLESEELVKEKKKVEEYKEKNNKLWQKIEKFLEARRINNYVTARPVKTIKQAREAIAELLEKTEKELEDYFKGENINDTNLALELEIYPKKEAKARQVLEWIKEARNTLDYEKLLERWCEGNEYNKEYNFDGVLHLLKKYLEVKEFEAPENELK
jgi:hypothetical protein